MDRKSYNECLRPYITGKMSKEDRRLAFCRGAKICSGKVSSEEEARQICLKPKPPKSPKTLRGPKTSRGRGASCDAGVREESLCVSNSINMGLTSDVNTIHKAILDAMLGCRCQK